MPKSSFNPTLINQLQYWKTLDAFHKNQNNLKQTFHISSRLEDNSIDWRLKRGWTFLSRAKVAFSTFPGLIAPCLHPYLLSLRCTRTEAGDGKAKGDKKTPRRNGRAATYGFLLRVRLED